MKINKTPSYGKKVVQMRIILLIIKLLTPLDNILTLSKSFSKFYEEHRADILGTVREQQKSVSKLIEEKNMTRLRVLWSV